MAIGIALLLGFHFNLNFDSPYKSLSITEFWRRWHISLSSWLKDYLYISLGGNRKGKLRQYVNLIVTMFLGGLWHGASWNFVLWGVLHGLALAVHKIWLELLAVSRLSIKIPNFVGAFFTFHFVCFCWIFFRNTSFENSLNMIRQIFVNFHVDVLPQMIIGYWPVFVLMMIGFL
jgi:D-alanyl-lipoteichoic acid acyltransferase DltB (MBOAT superfamily)